ncbi:MAG: CRISPR-associated helicase Cas3', partial [Oscillospiraceae bacterium]
MFAAHISEDKTRVQTVAEHCRETAEIARKHGQACGLENTSELAGHLHDPGKLTGEFNSYLFGESSISRGEIDHSFAGAKYVNELFSESKNKGWAKTAEMIGHVIVSHHGLHDWCSIEHNDYYRERISKNDNYEQIVAEINREFDVEKIKSLMPKAAEEYLSVIDKIKEMEQGASDKDVVRGFYLGMLERLLQSILIDADRTNTAEFMANEPLEREFNLDELWDKMQINLDKKLSRFNKNSDVISRQRKDISERCLKFAENDVGICKLVVPTGGGKTLSSMRFAIEYCKRHKMQKIIYVAPFMSILEQNSDEIRSLAGDEFFLEHYSDAVQQKFEKCSDNEYHDYELRTEMWDSPVIATTMVQFLNTLFLDKTVSVRRFHRLSKAVIIIDEVQSVPRDCVYPFNLAMNFLAKICGAAIVLCSATQPPFEAMPVFPLLLDKNSSMTGKIEEDFEVFSRTEIIPKLAGEYTYSSAADFAVECFEKNGSVLFITNTKEAAKNIYLELKSRLSEAENPPELIHLSVNMCPQHRRTAIAKMIEMLGDKKPLICVTTQLIEAGVNVSFGCVIRSLAGMDNAAQAAGRCNRSGEFNRICPVYLIELCEEKLGSLHEIQESKDASRQLLYSMEQSGESDFLSPDTMSSFFGLLFRTMQSEDFSKLCYPIPEAKSTLLDLLSVNSKNTALLPPERKKSCRYCMQAFKTAGSNFRVIKENTRDIFVPYNDEAKQLLVQMDSDLSYAQAL